VVKTIATVVTFIISYRLWFSDKKICGTGENGTKSQSPLLLLLLNLNVMTTF